MKTKNLILRVLTIVFSALMFVPMVTDFVTLVGKGKNSSASTSVGKKLSEINGEYKMEAFMTIAKILFYVAFALAMVLVVLEIVRFVTKKNDLVDNLTKFCALLVLALSVVTFVLTLIWGIGNSETIMGVQYNYWPWVGGVLTLVFGVIAGLCGYKEINEKPKKK